MGALKDWVNQDWVRIGSDGSIKGPCGTSKDKKNPDRCLPRKKAQSLSKEERAKTARKKKRAGAKGQTVETNSKRKFNGKRVPGTAVARGCGKIMSNRRKRTRGAVSQS